MASEFELAMRKKDISPDQMARDFGVSLSTIYYWRNNPLSLPVEKALKISEYLNEPFEGLFLRHQDNCDL